MIFDPFQTLGYVEDINVFVQPSDTVPYWPVLNPEYHFAVDQTMSKVLHTFLGAHWRQLSKYEEGLTAYDNLW